MNSSDRAAGSNLGLRPARATEPFRALSGNDTMPEPGEREYFVDAAEAARFLGIHQRTVLRMARDGKIPAHPLGDGDRKQWRFLISELDAWLRGRVNSAGRPCSTKKGA